MRAYVQLNSAFIHIFLSRECRGSKVRGELKLLHLTFSLVLH